MSEREMLEEHPAQLAELKAGDVAPPQPPIDPKSPSGR
jgi:hypothetical protein